MLFPGTGAHRTDGAACCHKYHVRSGNRISFQPESSIFSEPEEEEEEEEEEE